LKYVGIDLHSQYAQVALYHGGDFQDLRFSVDQSGVEQLCEWLAQQNPCEVAVEACGGAFALYDALAPVCSTVRIVDGRSFRERFPKRGKKTDLVDARNLALFASYQGAGIWVPDEKVRQARVLANDRVVLTELKTKTKNLIQSRLREYGKKPPNKVSIWTEDGMNWLFQQLATLPQAVAVSIDAQLRLLQLYHDLIDDLDRQIAEEAKQDKDVQLIMTVPGVDYYSAFIIKAEIGNHKRFDSPKRLVSYAGLNPKVSQSGKYCVTGSISRQGRPRLRWIVTECGISAISQVPALRSLHDRVKKRSRIAGKAKVAVGRKILELVWHILRTQHPYHQGKADLHERKMKRMHRRAAAYQLTTWRVAHGCDPVWRNTLLPTLSKAAKHNSLPKGPYEKSIKLDTQTKS
jgi:transposase